MGIEYILEPHSSSPYGIYECLECGSEFGGKETPIHKANCHRSKGFKYHYTLKEVKEWELLYTERGFLAEGSGLGTHLLKEAISSGRKTIQDAYEITKAYALELEPEYWSSIESNFIEELGSLE